MGSPDALKSCLLLTGAIRAVVTTSGCASKHSYGCLSFSSASGWLADQMYARLSSLPEMTYLPSSLKRA